MNRKKWSKLSVMLFILFVTLSCDQTIVEQKNDIVSVSELPILSHSGIVNKFATDYQQMPEKQIAMSVDSAFYAQYALPTDRYQHGALGDYLEAGQLVVYYNGVFYMHTLSEDYVFEDIRPRLYDVDGDSIPEVITIRTLIGRGAGIAIYKVTEEGLKEYTSLSEIGTSYRWLNIAAIEDMDEDGTVDILWVETPHIGGTLKVAGIHARLLYPSDAITYYSNHSGGSHNLCLSVVTSENGQKICYVPVQDRSKIVGFSYEKGRLVQQNEIILAVDFSNTLESQYPFCNVVSGHLNCITP